MDKSKIQGSDILQGKKFLFVTGSSGRRTLMSKIANELRKKFMADSFFLSFSTKTEDLFAAEGIPPEKVIHLVSETAPFTSPDKESPDKEFLRSKEDLYGFNIFDLWQLFSSRNKKRLRISSREILRQMEFYIKGIERIADKIRPDYVFITGISVFQGVLTQKIFTQKRIPVLDLTDCRIPGRFTFATTLDGRWPLLVKKYSKIKKEGLPSGQEAQALDFVQQFRLKPTKPDNSAKVKESLRAKLKRYHSYKNVLLYRREIPHVKAVLWHPVKDKIMGKSSRFENPVHGEKFIFFPLQIQPEASTSIWAKWYCNQLALIENLAKSVPCDHKIYVKEHVKDYSTRPFGFHKKIKKYPNVRLISPFANTINIIKNSSLVVTITGTSGWEAILLQKPVLTFGDVFYNIFDEVGHIKDFSDMPEQIKEKIGKTVDLKKTLEFVSAMQLATFDGIGTIPGDCQNRCLEEKNISKLVTGIELFLQEIYLPAHSRLNP